MSPACTPPDGNERLEFAFELLDQEDRLNGLEAAELFAHRVLRWSGGASFELYHPSRDLEAREYRAERERIRLELEEEKQEERRRAREERKERRRAEARRRAELEEERKRRYYAEAKLRTQELRAPERYVMDGSTCRRCRGTISQGRCHLCGNAP